MEAIIQIADNLRKNPNEKNWQKLSENLKKSGIIYYVVFFGEGKLSKTQDLRKSYVKLYNKHKKVVTEIPIFMTEGKKIRGATVYLKGLQILNK